MIFVSELFKRVSVFGITEDNNEPTVETYDIEDNSEELSDDYRG